MSDDDRIAAAADAAVDQIIADLSDRRGLSGEWDAIDDDLKDEIRLEWVVIVSHEIKKLLKGG